MTSKRKEKKKKRSGWRTMEGEEKAKARDRLFFLLRDEGWDDLNNNEKEGARMLWYDKPLSNWDETDHQSWKYYILQSGKKTGVKRKRKRNIKEPAIDKTQKKKIRKLFNQQYHAHKDDKKPNNWYKSICNNVGIDWYRKRQHLRQRCNITNYFKELAREKKVCFMYLFLNISLYWSKFANLHKI